MNNKKVQAQMQIDVSFVSDASKLVKSLQDATQKLDLSSPLAKQFETEMTKGFKDTLANMSKLEEGLSKKGLSQKTYTEFFNGMNLKIQESTKFLGSMKSGLQDIFNSKENKQALKDLESYKKQLQEINKLVASQKGAETRRSTAVSKMREETGINYEISKRTISQIAARKADKKDLTKSQQDWLQANGLDEAKLKRVLELLRQINAQDNKIHESNSKAKSITGQANVGAASSYLQKQVGKLEGTAIDDIKYKEWVKILKELDGTIEEVYKSSEKLDEAFKEELPRASQEAQKLADAQRTIKEILGQFGIVFSAATIVRGFQDLARSAFDFYKSLDSALNQIYVVSNLSSKAVDGLKSNFINMAKETGMALDDVTRSAVLFYQQGLNTDEVMTMTEVTAQFAKVAGIDATDAADKLTAAVNGYCLAAEDAMSVADKFNKVAAASAADINELSTAFSKAAAQANQAGVSMDNYLAYIATMEEATREAPENIGTGLKTIFSRMQQVKELGETMEDGATDINKVETALKSVGVELLDENRQLRDLEDVFAELGPMWNTLDRNTQAYLGTIIAGTRQQSRFITLMQNWDRVLELAEESEDSAGQQALMHAKAMESVESKVQQLNVAWQQFISNLTDSSAIKGVITILTKFVNVINGGNKPLTLLGLGVTLLSKKMKNLNMPIANKFKDLAANIKKAKTELVSFSEKRAALSTNKEEISKQKTVIGEDKQLLAKKQDELIDLTVNKELTAEQLKQKKNLEGEIESQKEVIRKDEERLRLLEEQNARIKNQVSGVNQVGKSLTALGASMQVIGLALGDADANLNGIVSTAGSAITGAGQIMTGNIVGGIASIGMAVIQGIDTWQNWEENINAKVTDAVNKVNESMKELNNITTSKNSLEKLIKKYHNLSNKVYRTKEEQSALNDVVQQMGDMLDIDTVADSYGNLSINIQQVTKDYDDMITKQDDALKKMRETERQQLSEAQSGLGNHTSLEEFYSKLMKSNKTEYRSLITGIQDNLNNQTRSISENLYETINAAFKTSLENHINENLVYFSAEGMADSFVNLQKGIMSKLDSSDKWNYMYDQIEYFQKNINDLSWNDFTSKFEEAFGAWRKEIGLTTDEWIILRDTIENTIYGGRKEYVDFMNAYDDSAASDYQLYKEKYEQVSKEVKEKIGEKKTGLEGNGISEMGGELIPTHSGFEELYKYWKDSGKQLDKRDNIWETIGLNKYDSAFGEYSLDELDEMLRRYDEALTKYEELKKRQEKDGEAKVLHDSIANLTGKTADKITSIGTLYDRADFMKNSKGEATDNYNDVSTQNKENINTVNKLMAEAVNAAKDYVNDTDIGLALVAKINEQLEQSNLNDDVKNYLKKVRQEIEDEMPRTGTHTWAGIKDSLDKYTESLKTANNALLELKENGQMSTETFDDLAQSLDNLSLEDVFESFSADNVDEATKYIDGLVEAMKNLDVQYDMNTGAVKVNADALEYLRDAQERAAKGKIQAMIKDLAASKASAEMQVGYIDAQIAAIDAMIGYLDAQGDQTVNTDQMMAQADTEYGKVFGQVTDNTVNAYKDLTGDNATWAETTIHNIANVTDAWSKYWQAVRNGSGNAKELLKKAKDVSSGYFKDTNSFSKATNIKLDDINGLSGNDSKVQAKKEELKKYKQGLLEARAKYGKTVSLYQGRIEYLQGLLNSDLSKLGTGKNGKDKEKQITEYIGKLWEIYNVINKIEAAEKRLGILEKANSKAYGKAAANLMKERLRLSKSTLELRRNELLQQKNYLKSEQYAISNSMVGNVFSFAANGEIQVNYEKYRQLQDRTIDGEKSLKELADDLWDEYKTMYEGINKYAEEYINNIDEIIDLEEEQLKTYIQFEKDVASATKEIYQEMLDNKLDAIDKEINALDKLREARKRNREDEQNSRDLSKTQISLNRALMDTSGASNIKQLDYRDQIRQKLEDMGETAYERKMDDIKQTLEDQKDMLQKAFDEFFKDWEQFYKLIESRILTSEDAAIDVLKHTSSYREASDIERQQMIRDWGTQYQTAMTDIGAGRTIKDVYDSINALRSDMLNSLDSTVATGVAGDRIGREISTAIREFFQSYGSTNTDKELRDLFGSAVFASGGIASFTGPAWLDGTKSAPEAVLNAAQTKAFMNFANCIEKMNLQDANGLGSNNITISSIEFNVESMSSPEDGEKAFDAFVQRFNDIGKRTGIALTTTQKV